MKAVILAAGKGRRGEPLTNRRPKPMVPIADAPLLEYVVEAVIEAGIDEIVLVADDTVVGADSPFAAEGDWSGAFTPCTPDFNADDVRTRASISTLADYEFDVVLVSHGENVRSGGREEIDGLVADLA